MTQHNMTQHDMARHDMTQHDMAQHDIVTRCDVSKVAFAAMKREIRGSKFPMGTGKIEF